MRITIKRTIAVICAGLCLFSMAGCFSSQLSPTPTLPESLSGEMVSGFLKDVYYVQPYDGDVPDGMEIKYVVVKEVSRGCDRDDDKEEYQYDYDKAGRQNVRITVSKSCTTQKTITFNDDGTVAKKEFKKLTKDYGHHGIEYVAEYKYNENKQLISYTVTEGDCPAVTYNFEYENGHLISGDIFENHREYEYCTSGQYYDYFAKVWEGFDYDYVVIPVKRFYADDSFEQIIVEEDYNSDLVHYEYDGDVMTGWHYVDKGGYTHKYDAKGHFLGKDDKDGNCIEKWEYNEFGDVILREDYDNGKVVDRSTSTYDYDDKGNILLETTVYGSLNGKEGTRVWTTKYNYDEYGLLKSKVKEIDGKFWEMTVYAYKAIVVPAEG